MSACLVAPRTIAVALLALAGALAESSAGVPATLPINESVITEAAVGTNEGQSESGITGQVSIRPVRPHVTYGTPNQTPYQAKIDVLDSGGRVVTTFETDQNGNFRISLRPGKYVLRPQSPGPYPRASDQTVVVSPRSFTQVRVVYDSGIR